MSEEDQSILTSYSNLVPVIKFLSTFNTSGIPTSNPSKQAFTLVWYSGAHHLRWGVLSQPHVITPSGFHGKYSLTPCYGQLDHFGLLWPLGQILKPLALLANSPPHQPPGQDLCFGPGGPSGLQEAGGPSIHHHGLWPNPFDYVV
ncbi:hypothetical protein O181_029831 [Austropuccinia psidii MF-1]|uniref:Uncharacterized protein n=1 Tax=Austropuccinia psidii MF-1 TaxID=1389203 RepID=A0A9Q3CX95_9BASI|nr:hypothetical protein [Austropuccinia psidii MF-1]